MAIRGSVSVITISGADQVVLSPSEKRCAIIFISAPGNTGTVAINNRILLSSSDGFQAAAAISGVKIVDSEFGDLVKAGWHCFGSSANDKLVVIEGVYV